MKAFLMFALFFLSVTASADLRVVHVTGSCARQAVPDRGQVTVTSEAQDMDAQKAARIATERFEKFREEAKKLNLPDFELQTTEYSVITVKDWENQKYVFRGYRVRIGTKVTTSAMNKLGEVVAVASKAEIKDVGSLSTFMSEEKQRTEQRECLKDAALDARARALKLSETLGAKLGKTISVRESGLSPIPQERVMMAKAELSDSVGAPVRGSPPPQFDAGTHEVRMAVEIAFEMN